MWPLVAGADRSQTMAICPMFSPAARWKCSVFGLVHSSRVPRLWVRLPALLSGWGAFTFVLARALSLWGGWLVGWVGGDKSPGATEVTQENSRAISQTVVGLLSDVKPPTLPPPDPHSYTDHRHATPTTTNDVSVGISLHHVITLATD